MGKNKKRCKRLSNSRLMLSRIKSSNISENFFITNFNIWKIYNDQPIGFHCLFPPALHDSQKKVFNGNCLNPETILSKSGFFLKKDGSEILFQSFFNTFFRQASIIKVLPTQLLNQNVILGYELLKKNQSKDIVQGLPKIESLIEAYSPKNIAKFTNRSGISFIKNFQNKPETTNITNFESLFSNDVIVSYGNRLYKLRSIPFCFAPGRMELEVKHSDLESEKRPWSQETVYSVIAYEFSNNKKGRQFLHEAKVSLRKKIGKYSKKKFKDKYFPKKNSVFWLYKMEKFIPFKWLKVRPIIWQTGIFAFQTELPFFSYSQNYIKWTKKGKFSDYESNNLIVQTAKGKYYYLESLASFANARSFTVPKTYKKDFQFNSIPKTKFIKSNFLNFNYFGENNIQKILNIQTLLLNLFSYQSLLDGSYVGLFKALLKFQLLLALSIDDSYKSQGINISLKNIEIVVKQMTDKVVVEDPKKTNLLPLETLKLVTYKVICQSIISYNQYQSIHFNRLKKVTNSQFSNFPIVKPKVISATNSVFLKEGFLSQAGFQNTKKVLTKAAIEGPLDWLTNLKQQIICGQSIAAGSAFLNFKYNLDKIYLFKKKNN